VTFGVRRPRVVGDIDLMHVGRDQGQGRNQHAPRGERQLGRSVSLVHLGEVHKGCVTGHQKREDGNGTQTLGVEQTERRVTDRAQIDEHALILPDDLRHVAVGAECGEPDAEGFGHGRRIECPEIRS